MNLTQQTEATNKLLQHQLTLQQLSKKRGGLIGGASTTTTSTVGGASNFLSGKSFQTRKINDKKQRKVQKNP